MRDWECISEHGDVVPCEQILVLNMGAIGHRANNGDMYLSNRVRSALNSFDNLSAKF